MPHIHFLQHAIQRCPLSGMLPVSYTASFLLLLPLLVQAWKTVGYAHSLCLNLTVKSQSRPRHPWYVVQGSVNKKPFLQYDSDSSKFRPLGLLGQKVNATKAWTQLTQTLGEVGQELRMILPDIKLENTPPTLDNQWCCQHEAQWCPTASWRFNINGQAALLFDTMNVTWTVMNPGARGVKEEWEDKGLADYFRRISMGDCNHWLGELLEHWEKVLEPPGK
ncbi:LOW QUALITY PROTEIN: retinoic acid early transcript 1E-like [Lutra lutra]|uniref:LOW QUALITY PROTEIN: retinoic acid early transcript 1E-like n=1 Tax=Lutra lutra TaxID=9657 RepID=UPI001FD00F9F|nr:LOW QUALITY PROTEIN: retinoic acid early transcript 1E-like [Lutra lutra]